MRIGVLTLHSQTNYGGVLQAYALQHFLSCNGHEAEVVDYWLDPTNTHLLGKWLSQSKPLWYRVLRFPLSVVRDGFVLSEIRRRKRTIQFLREHIKLSDCSYKTLGELSSIAGYDAIIVGSDQVWHPFNILTPNPFLLSWLRQDSGRPRKIAYAASFGTGTIPASRTREYHDGLKDFDAIGSREEEGRELVKQLVGRDAVRVLDPSLLLSKKDWLELIPEVKSPRVEPYIFCYWLGDMDKLQPLLESLVKSGKHVKFLTDWKGGRRLFRRNLPFRLFLLRTRRIQCCFDACPQEFIQLIAQAESVLSDSFHAMMFGTIFEKPMCIVHKSSKAREPMGARLLGFAQEYSIIDVVHEYIPENLTECAFSLFVVTKRKDFEKDQAQSCEWIRCVLSD